MGGAAKNPTIRTIGDTLLPGQGSAQAVAAGEQTDLEKRLSNLSRSAFMEGRPFRQDFLSTAIGLMNGTQNIEDLPGYQNQLALANRQMGDAFGTALNQTLANTPVGATGLKQRAMEQSALGLAEQRGTLANAIAEQLLNNYLQGALGLSTAGLAPGLSGAASAANAFGSRWNAGIGSQNQTQETSANFFADMFGGMGKK